MNNRKLNGVHWSFWVIGAVALIWHVMGVMNFLMQLNAEAVAEMPEQYRAIIEVRPPWATVFFGLAVFGGAIGCLLLLLKKSIATYLFIASLVGVVVQMVPFVGMSGSPIQIWIGTLMSMVIASFLIWYSKRSERKGWIRTA